MNNHKKFLKAIHEKKVLRVKFDSFEKGIITRKCILYDYGPSRKYMDGQKRYHFYDLDSPKGSHNLSIIPSQLIDIEILNETFEPGKYVTWEINWFISRDWREFS